MLPSSPFSKHLCLHIELGPVYLSTEGHYNLLVHKLRQLSSQGTGMMIMIRQ